MSWPLGKLSEIADVISGYAFKSYWFGEGSAKVIRIGDLQNGNIDLEHAVTIDDSLNKIKSQFKIQQGDILMALSGATVGKIAVADEAAAGCYLNQRVAIVRSKKTESLSYLKYVFSGDYLSKLLLEAGGAAQPNLSPKDLANMEIPLPPLAEQKRIAAILDKADAIRRKRQQAIQLADDFLRAVFLEMFGDPVTNPKGWEVKLLKDIAKIQIGPFGTQLHKEDYVSDGIPLVNPSHIKNSEVVPDCNLTVNKTKFEELTEYHLAVGDIIMGRRGEMGRCALIGERESGWLCGTGSLYIRPFVNNAQSFYLFKYLTSDYIKTYLEGESLGATMPNLNKTIVGNIKVPMPSTTAITKFQKILAADKAYREKITLIDNSLFESLSQKAFSGQL